MSIHCMQRVWEHSGQKGAALFLFIAITGYASRFRQPQTANGFAFPALQTLARGTRLSRRHITRLIAGLQSAGELRGLPHPGRIPPRPGRGGHLYVVLTAADPRRLPPSHLCFQIMFTARATDPLIFNPLYTYFNRNLLAKTPMYRLCFPNSFPPLSHQNSEVSENFGVLSHASPFPHHPSTLPPLSRPSRSKPFRAYRGPNPSPSLAEPFPRAQRLAGVPGTGHANNPRSQ